MKRKLLSVLLCAGLCMGLIGCGTTANQTVTDLNTPPVSGSASGNVTNENATQNGTVQSGVTTSNVPNIPGNYKVTAGSVEAAPGQTVTVPVSISANVNVAALTLTVTYDPSVLTYQSYADGDAVSGAMGLGNVAQTGVFTYAMISLNPLNQAGDLFTLTFKVNNDAKPATTHLQLNQLTFSDENNKEIPVSLHNGSVVIK
ncbi:MAG: hypothetical protein IKT68_03355 [Clostridia bacterium]|nr:hypothetical protein [Clostridia bacterium]